VHVFRPAKGESDQPGARGRVGHLVEEDEPARVPVVGVRVVGHDAVGCKVAQSDFVCLELFGRGVAQRVHIHPVPERGDAAAHRARADPHPVGAAGHERFLVRPDEERLELVGNRRGGVGTRDQIARARFDLVLQDQRRRLARPRGLQLALRVLDSRHAALLPGWQRAHAIPLAERTRRHEAGDAFGRAGLDGKAHRALARPCIDRYLVEVLHQRRPAIPWRVGAACCDVVSAQRRDGNGDDVLQAKTQRVVLIFTPGRIEDIAGITHGVHLVHGQHHASDAELRGDIAMAPRVREHTFARVHQDDGDVGRKRACGQLGCKVLLSRRGSDREAAPPAGKRLGIEQRVLATAAGAADYRAQCNRFGGTCHRMDRNRSY